MIFGIGLGRTGTLSLAAALRELGLDAEHWDTSPVLPAWDLGDYDLPADLDALIEGPPVRLWRAFDRLYPGSRFILTTREKKSWLASVERWLGRWEPRPGSKWYCRRLFFWGTARFHRTVMSALYDEHHEAVRYHFAGRADDLLELDIPGSEPADLWAELAEFLGLDPPPPGTAFPHLHASG